MIVSKTIELELPFCPFNSIGKLDEHCDTSDIFSRLENFSEELTSNLQKNLVEDMKKHNLLRKKVVKVRTDEEIEDSWDRLKGEGRGDPELEKHVKWLCGFLRDEMTIGMDYIPYVEKVEGIHASITFKNLLKTLKSKYMSEIDEYSKIEDHEYTNSWGFQWKNEEIIVEKFYELRLKMYKDFKCIRNQMDEVIMKYDTTDEDSPGYIRYQENTSELLLTVTT